jgi:hypothetical protein
MGKPSTGPDWRASSSPQRVRLLISISFEFPSND